MQKCWLLLIALVCSAASAAENGAHHHVSPNKPTPSKPATAQPALKSVPPTHPNPPTQPPHDVQPNPPVLRRLVPVVKPSPSSTDPAECLRIGGTGQRNEYGQCMGWDGKPL